MRNNFLSRRAYLAAGISAVVATLTVGFVAGRQMSGTSSSLSSLEAVTHTTGLHFPASARIVVGQQRTGLQAFIFAEIAMPVADLHDFVRQPHFNAAPFVNSKPQISDFEKEFESVTEATWAYHSTDNASVSPMTPIVNSSGHLAVMVMSNRRLASTYVLWAS